MPTTRFGRGGGGEAGLQDGSVQLMAYRVPCAKPSSVSKLMPLQTVSIADCGMVARQCLSLRCVLQ